LLDIGTDLSESYEAQTMCEKQVTHKEKKTIVWNIKIQRRNTYTISHKDITTDIINFLFK